MKRFIQNLRKNETWQALLIGVTVCGICLITFFYMLSIDISKAPTFIYSQF